MDKPYKKGSFRKLCCYLIFIPKDSGVMNQKKPCLTREKKASLIVQSEKRRMQGKNPAFGIFPKAPIYAKTAIKKEAAVPDCASFP
jgi:hypothetical protein